MDEGFDVSVGGWERCAQHPDPSSTNGRPSNKLHHVTEVLLFINIVLHSYSSDGYKFTCGVEYTEVDIAHFRLEADLTDLHLKICQFLPILHCSILHMLSSQ